MPSKFLTVKNEKGKTPEILVYGPIMEAGMEDYGVTAEAFVNALNDFPKGTKVTIGWNSQGGNVGAGLAIYNAIDRRSADITSRIDGYALSIASVAPMASSRVVIPKTAIMMMHEAAALTFGAKGDKSKDAEMLSIHDDVICTAYCVKSGKAESRVKADMKAETWMSGSEAIAYGLGDEETDTPTNFFPVETIMADGRPRFKNCPEHFRAVLNGPAPISGAPKSGEDPKPTPANQGGATQNTMNKEKIIALLKKHGVEAKADWTDEQFETALAKLAEKPAPKTPENAADKTAIELLQEQLKTEKTIRITNEVKRRGENKIANDRINVWVARAMSDEANVLAEIDSMPVAFSGGQPISGASVIITENDNVFDRIKKLPTAKERHRAALNDWENIYKEACKRDQRNGLIPLAAWDTSPNRSLPQNSNTISATITTSFLIDGSVTDLQNVWPVLNAFSVEYSTDPYKPKATGVLKHVTAATATQTNATNFELGDSTVAPVSVTMNQYTQPFNISSDDMSGGVRLENLRTLNLATFANKVIEVATAPITTANFAGNAGDGTPVVVAAANFGFNELAILQAALKKSPIKNLVLDGSYVARIANVPQFYQMAGVVGGDNKAWKAFGWDGIFPSSDWTGAGANIQGFACHPQAITGLTGLPLIPPNIPGGIFAQTTFMVPGVGATVMLSAWFNPATRKFWTAYDIMAGFKETDLTAGFILKSA